MVTLALPQRSFPSNADVQVRDLPNTLYCRVGTYSNSKTPAARKRTFYIFTRLHPDCDLRARITSVLPAGIRIIKSL